MVKHLLVVFSLLVACVADSVAKEIKINVKADAAPKIWAWISEGGSGNLFTCDWSGRPTMTKPDGSGWYVQTFTVEDGQSIGFKLTPAGSDNGAEIGKVSEDYYCSYDGNTTITRLNADGSDYAVAASGYFVYFNNGGATDWTAQPYCYIYGSSAGDNGWAGKKMTYDADLVVNGVKGWFYYSMPSGFQDGNVIITDGGSNQYPAYGDPKIEIGGASIAIVYKDGEWGNSGVLTSLRPASFDMVEDGRVFTLGGQEVRDTQNLPAGVYIKGGKKIVVK